MGSGEVLQGQREMKLSAGDLLRKISSGGERVSYDDIKVVLREINRLEQEMGVMSGLKEFMLGKLDDMLAGKEIVYALSDLEGLSRQETLPLKVFERDAKNFSYVKDSIVYPLILTQKEITSRTLNSYAETVERLRDGGGLSKEEVLLLVKQVLEERLEEVLSPVRAVLEEHGRILGEHGRELERIRALQEEVSSSGVGLELLRSSLEEGLRNALEERVSSVFTENLGEFVKFKSWTESQIEILEGLIKTLDGRLEVLEDDFRSGKMQDRELESLRRGLIELREELEGLRKKEKEREEGASLADVVVSEEGGEDKEEEVLTQTMQEEVPKAKRLSFKFNNLYLIIIGVAIFIFVIAFLI